MTHKTKLIFLDRDGVINTFPGMGNYVTRQKDFRFLPRVKEAIRLLSRSGFQIYVISNQGCVARGMISKKGLESMTERMLQAIEKKGGKIDGVYYCTHQTDDSCGCKKPKPKLFKKAIGGKKVNLKKTFFIGDSLVDIEAARNVGCKSLLVLSGRIKKREVKRLIISPNVVKKDLWSAARWITQKKY